MCSGGPGDLSSREEERNEYLIEGLGGTRDRLGDFYLLFNSLGLERTSDLSKVTQ